MKVTQSRSIIRVKKRPLVVVEWEDTTSSSGWDYEEDRYNDPTAVIFTVGWQIKSHRDRLILSSQHNKRDNQIGGTWVIPRGCIKSIRRLE